MSIEPLPPSTVRAIGSSQVLTYSSSVVKELIDNALDARATNISVEISANTLDTIQVRDNGHGIAPDDRPLVCRRYCTSKIRDFADIKSVGGRWLGFRGEALASVAEISGGLSVTTRVESEDVAVTLKIGRDGETVGKESVSHPVGTTAKVSEFLKTLPVRKQTALKATTKTLARVKRMMQAYALAKPHVRMALRVLKAKNNKGDWIYAPKPGAGTEDAVYKVVGKDCVSQCAWTVFEDDGFEFQAFAPRGNADCNKISNTGHFISIDSRPISTARGTFKDVITIFKEKLREVMSDAEAIRDPFLYLNIACPPDSYDPNVEPAKDDVMFEDSEKVLRAFRKLLDSFYGRAAPAPISKIAVFEDSASTTMVDRSPATRIVAQRSDESSDVENSRPAKRQRRLQSHMYDSDEEAWNAVEDLAVQEQVSNVDSEVSAQNCSRVVDVPNPWIMAKMQAPIKHTARVSTSGSEPLTPLRDITNTRINRSSPLRPMDPPIRFLPPLPTPAPSSQRAPDSSNELDVLAEEDGGERAIRCRIGSRRQLTHGVEDRHEAVISLSEEDGHRRRANDFISAAAMLRGVEDEAELRGRKDEATPQRRSRRNARYARTDHDLTPTELSAHVDHAQPDRCLRVSSTGTPLSEIPDSSPPKRQSATARKQRNANSKTIVPAVRDDSVTWFGSSPSQRQAATTPQTMQQKQNHGQDIRALLRGRASPSPQERRAPHNKAAQEGQEDFARAFEAVQDADPQRDIQAPPAPAALPQSNVLEQQPALDRRSRRLRSSHLPLAFTPEKFQVQNLVLHKRVSLRDVQDAIDVSEPAEFEYCLFGVSDEHVALWASDLGRVVARKMPSLRLPETFEAGVRTSVVEHHAKFAQNLSQVLSTAT